ATATDTSCPPSNPPPRPPPASYGTPPNDLPIRILQRHLRTTRRPHRLSPIRCRRRHRSHLDRHRSQPNTRLPDIPRHQSPIRTRQRIYPNLTTQPPIRLPNRTRRLGTPPRPRRHLRRLRTRKNPHGPSLGATNPQTHQQTNPHTHTHRSRIPIHPRSP